MLGVNKRMGLKLFGREIIFEEFQPIWSRYLIVTDGRTDRQTERRTDGRHAISARASRGKNGLTIIVIKFALIYRCFRLLVLFWTIISYHSTAVVLRFPVRHFPTIVIVIVIFWSSIFRSSIFRQPAPMVMDLARWGAVAAAAPPNWRTKTHRNRTLCGSLTHRTWFYAYMITPAVSTHRYRQQPSVGLAYLS